MELFTKTRSRFIWCDFTVRGVRYRQSTKETNRTRAGIAAAKLMAAVEEQTDVLRVKKAKTLRETAVNFVKFIDESRLDHDTKRYYKNGLRMLEGKSIMTLRLDHIRTEHVEALRFPGGPSNTNCALRTLRRILSRAKLAKMLRELPTITLLAERERDLLLDEAAEQALMPHAEQPLADIIPIMRDTGMRNQRELYAMRIENLDFVNQLIRVPDSKTEAGRRLIPMSPRVADILRRRCDGRESGWVFQGRYKDTPISAAFVNHQWTRARRKAGLPADLVLYCGRHDYGTHVLNSTGNLKATMMVMGHMDVKTAMKYQKPGLEIVARAMNSRHTLRHSNGTQKIVSA